MDLKDDPYLQLHSKYNPEAEALRYINSINLTENIECFILIEPGKGYMVPVLEQKFPNAKIIDLHVNDSDPERILEKEIPAYIETKNIKIIEWRPAMNYYKEEYVKLLSKTVKFLKQTDAEKRTVKAFGKRWVKNFFRNLNLIDSVILYKETDIPVIITGSGPSLETAMPKIKEAEDKCLIIAASSSVLALANAGIKPDLVIATDGGLWAQKHLYGLFRNEKVNNINHKEFSQEKSSLFIGMAVNLCAALPSQCGSIPLLLLNDGSLWQNTVLHELQLPSVLIPERGTVTASAVELALTLTGGNIYLAGCDLAVNDIRTHARPYAFDNLLLGNADRFTPYYSQCFMRSHLMKEGGSLNIYAEWFKKQYEIWPKRIHFFNEELGMSNEQLINKIDCLKIVELKDTDNFRERGSDALHKALKGEYAEQLKTELGALVPLCEFKKCILS